MYYVGHFLFICLYNIAVQQFTWNNFSEQSNVLKDLVFRPFNVYVACR